MKTLLAILSLFLAIVSLLACLALYVGARQPYGERFYHRERQTGEHSLKTSRLLLQTLHRLYDTYDSGAADAPEDIPQIRSLLQRGADVNIPVQDGLTPLLLAATCRRHDTALLLIDKGAQVNVRSRRGITPMMLAAFYGWCDVIDRLLERGGDINAQDNEGQTPLMRAASHGSVETVRLLIDKGADTSFRDHYGNDALQVAHSADVPQIETLLRQASTRNRDGKKICAGQQTDARNPLLFSGNKAVETYVVYRDLPKR